MKTRKRKFGFTLVEMSVALAVTAIMMVMISTLTITVFDRRATVEKQYNQSNEITEITALMQSWFDEIAKDRITGSAITFIVSDDGKTIISGSMPTDDGDDVTSVTQTTDNNGNLVFTVKTVTQTTDNNGNLVFTVKTESKTLTYINDIVFSVPESDKDSIVMTIKYDSFDKSEFSMKFLYCGQVFKNE